MSTGLSRPIVWVSLSLIMVMAGGCTLNTLPPTPTSQLYKRYVPTPHSLFQLQFEYPNTWILLGLSLESPIRVDLFLSEASSPTPSPGDEGNPNEPLIALAASRVDASSFSFDQEVDRFLAGYRGSQFSTITADEMVEIDGHPGRKITLRIEPPRALGDVTMLHETIFLLVDDRYYQLHMQIPEHTQHGAFAQGFQHLVDSVEIMH